MTRKLIIYDGRNEREVALVGTLIVGRDPSCHISDLDPLLSRRHAEFVSTAKGVTLRDLGSRNGMLVNGDKVTERRLVDGDVVQLGHLQFRFVEDKTVLTPEEHTRANATTAQAFDHSTLSTPAASRVEDHVAPADSAREDRTYKHGDGDYTRVSMPPGSDPTFVRPAAADPDATFATPPPRPEIASDDAETFAGRAARVLDPDAVTPQPLPAVSADNDETFAGPAREIRQADANEIAAPAFHDSGETLLEQAHDFDVDRTFVVTPIPRSAIVPPAPASEEAVERVSVTAPVDLDATLGPGEIRSEDLGLEGLFPPAPVASAPTGQPARVVAGPDRRIRTASVACGQLLGTAPDRLIGLTLEELFAKSLRLVEDADGPATVSVQLERSPSDQTLTLIISAGEAAEPVS